MSKCPNKSLPEWKALVEKVGENAAYYHWFNNDESIPENIEYEQKTSTSEPISMEEFEWQRKQLQSKFGAEIVFDTNLDVVANVKQNGENRVITVNPNSIFSDTLVHEIGHIYIDTLGGLSNPMILQGVKQLIGTTLEAEVRRKYADKSEEHIQKEMLATAIGLESVDIFKGKKNLIDKFNNWLDLFFNRVKQLFGISPNIAKQIANEIINTSENISGSIEDIYDMRVKDISLKSIKDVTDKIVNRLQIQINKYASILDEGTELQQEQIKDIKLIVSELQATNAKKGIIDFISKANDRLTTAEDRLLKISKADKDGYLTINPVDLIQINEFIKAYKDIEDILHQFQTDPDYSDVEQEIFDLGNKSIATYKSIETRNINLQKKYLIQVFSQSDNSPTYLKFKDQFISDFDKKNNNVGFFTSNKINGKKVKGSEYNAARDKYVFEQLSKSKELIQAKELERLKSIMDQLPNDLSFTDLFYETGYINEDFLQVATQIIKGQNFKTMTENIELEQEALDVFEAYSEDHKETNQTKKYDALIDDELDSNGKKTGKKISYLKGEYNASFYIYLNDINKKVRDAKEIFEADVSNKENKKNYEKLVSDRSDWIKSNTVRISNKSKPSNKWKNTINRSESEQNLYDYILKSRAKTQENYKVKQSKLDFTFDDTIFRKLPSINKIGIEKATEENPVEITRNWWSERFKVRADDVDYKSSSLGFAIGDEDNRLSRTQPVYFRKESEEQSFDLMTIHLMDETASIKYKNNRMIIPTLEIMKQVASQRDIEVTESVFKRGLKKIKNVYSDPNDPQDLVIEGINTRQYKVLDSLINASMYGVRKKEGDQASKIIDSLIQMSSNIIMTFNYFSALPNAIQGRLSNLLESNDISGISKDSAIKADLMIVKDFPNIISDIGKLRPTSFTGLLAEFFNPTGSYYGSDIRFAKNSRTKQLFDRGLLFSFSSMGEYYVHNGLMIGALLDQKLLSKNGDYVDVDGEITKDVTKAASLIDYMSAEEDGLVFNKDNKFKNVYRTTFSEKPIGEDLFSDVSYYIRDIAISTQGNYSSDLWVHSQQYAGFRAVESLRRWMVPGFEKRWRGFTSVFDEDESGRVLDSRRRGDRRSGSYVDTIRFSRSLGKSIKKMKFDILRSDWENLSSRERANIRKSTQEASLWGSLFAVSYVVSQIKDDRKEDIPDSVLFVIFALRRVQAELGFYANPLETLRILRSPAASISMLEKTADLLAQATTDFTNMEFEEYERGDLKGTTKIRKKLYNVLPGFSQINRNVETALNYLENPAVK